MSRERRQMRHQFKQLVADRLANAEVESADGMKLLKYETDGKFDYELYKEAQTLGNKIKLQNQWVPEEHIEILAKYLKANGEDPKNGICHGTHQGYEQTWFMVHLGDGSDVFGTEISDTATEFPHTIQWDFHEVKDEWVGAKDFVYSNSWDHSFDPKMAFRNWANCLKPGGFLLLDHGWNYQVDRVNPLDPFGISEEGLVDLLNTELADLGEVVEVIDGGRHKRFPIRTVIFRRKK